MKKKKSVLLPKYFLSIAIVSFYLCMILQSFAVEIKTNDGLNLTLDVNSGRISEVHNKGVLLPTTGSALGGIKFSEAKAISPKTVFFDDFSSASRVRLNAQNSNWNAPQTYFTLFESGGVENSPYIRFGNGSTTGCGVAYPDKIPLIPTGIYSISFKGRTLDIASTYIVCLRVFDAAGADITASSKRPSGWGYSQTSLAHYIAGIANTQPNIWEDFSFEYIVPENAVSAELSLRYWTGGNLYLDVDNIKMELKHAVEFSPYEYVEAPVQNPYPNLFVQNYQPAGKNIRILNSIEAKADHLSFNVAIEDSGEIKTERALRVVFNLPVDAVGWNWGDDILTERVITSGDKFSNCFTMLSRDVSYYSWSAVYNSETGISLASPLNVPRVSRFEYVGGEGYNITFDIALSPLTLNIGSGKASVSFIIYNFDPKWKFRAASDKYYKIYPQYFLKSIDNEGCWEYPIAPDIIPNPLDFGFSYFECSPQPQSVVDLCAQLGIRIFLYTEPWGVWQNYGDITDKPSYEDRIGTINTWAENTTTTLKWMNAPRYMTAQAVQNAGYKDFEGKYYIDFNSYFWHQWSGKANQFWPCYPSWEIPGNTIVKIHKQYLLDAKANQRNGTYIDSISASGSVSSMEDFNSSHFQYTHLPLTFSLKNAKTVLPSQMAQHDYLVWLKQYELDNDKYIIGNLFAPGCRFYGYLLDMSGSEVIDELDSDSESAIKRTSVGKKVVSNLLQWWKGDIYVTRSEIESYIKNQMFWGFFPGVASCGGGTSWGQTPVRYFLHPELYERDRDLFRKYIPIIKSLSAAGWEPVTYAKPDNASVKVERFGNWDDKQFYLTLKNDSETTLTSKITIYAADIGIAEDQREYIFCDDMLNLKNIKVDSEGASDISFNTILSPKDTAVYKICMKKSGILLKSIGYYR